VITAPALLAAAPAPVDPAFQAGLAHFEQGDASVDARALRWQNRARLGGRVPEWDQAQAAWATIERDPARSLALAQAQRQIDPLNLNALYLEEQAFRAWAAPMKRACAMPRSLSCCAASRVGRMAARGKRRGTW